MILCITGVRRAQRISLIKGVSVLRAIVQAYLELKRMKDKGRDSTFFVDDVPDADTTPGQGKTSSLKPSIFVTVPVNNFGKWAFSTIGLNWPDWKILEP
jgi:hypothetical protein